MIAYLLTQCTIALFGLPAILHPSLRRESLPLRIVAAFVAGSVLLTVEALLLSYAGLSWGERTLPVPIVLATAFAAWKWRSAEPAAPAKRIERVPVVAVIAMLTAAAWLFHATHVTRAAESYESNAVIGAKASRMAEARGVMFEWRRLDTTATLRPADPPLAEITRAWSQLVVQREAWEAATSASTLWIFITLIGLVSLLRRMIGERESWTVAAYWFIALALAVVDARAMGGGEPLFLCFTTLAAVATRSDSNPAFTISFWSLAAMALTRPEGVVFALALAATAASRRPLLLVAPAISALLWFVPTAMNGVLLPLRPEFRFDPLSVFAAGSFGLAFVLPLLMHFRMRKPPALLFVAALILLTHPAVTAQMTLPSYAPSEPHAARALLPLLSIVILSGAFATFRRERG